MPSATPSRSRRKKKKRRRNEARGFTSFSPGVEVFMDVTNILSKAKTALRIVTDAFDGEITDLIEAGYQTLSTRGVNINDPEAPMVLKAVLTYVRMYFGQPDDYDRLRAAWETQLGQLMTTTGFTRWSDGQE